MGERKISAQTKAGHRLSSGTNLKNNTSTSIIQKGNLGDQYQTRNMQSILLPGIPKHSDSSCRKGFLNAIKSRIVICLWKRKCWDVAFGLGIINQWEMDRRVDARTLYHCFVFYWSPDEPGFVTPRWWRADRFFSSSKQATMMTHPFFMAAKVLGLLTLRWRWFQKNREKSGKLWRQ